MKRDSLNQLTGQDTADRAGKARPARRRSRLAMTVAAALAGGSMLTTCESRLRDAVVNGSKDYLFSILDPNAIVDALFGDEDAEEQ